MAFTGVFEANTIDHCIHYGERRFYDIPSQKGQLRPRKRWLYLLIAYRLLCQYRTPLAEFLTAYRALYNDWEEGKNSLNDVFSGDLYQ